MFVCFLFQLNSAVTRAFGETPTNLCGTPSWRKELMEKSQANKKRNEVNSLLLEKPLLFFCKIFTGKGI